MPITVNCACGKQYPVKDEFAGQRVKCPGCGQVLTIPSPKQNTATNRAAVSPSARRAVEKADPTDAVEIVKPPVKKKSGKGWLFALLGCGCLTLLLGTGLAAVVVVIVVGGVGVFSITSNNAPVVSNTDSAKGKDMPVDPNKDKPVDPNKDKPVDPNKDKPVDPNKDKAVDPDKDKGPNEKPPPVVEKGPWKGHQASITALRFIKNRDGEFAVTAAGGLEKTPDNKIVLAPDNTVRFWNLADGLSVRSLDIKDGITVAAISPDGSFAAVTYPGKAIDGGQKRESDHKIHIWNLQTMREKLPPLEGHTEDVICMAFRKNGAQLLSGGRDNMVRLWSIRESKEMRSFPGHLGNITAVAFNPKSEEGVSCSADGSVRLWDLATDPDANALLREFKGHKDIVWAAAFNDEGTQLLTGGGMKVDKNSPTGFSDGDMDTEIRLWNVADATEIKRFKGHTKAVTCLAFAHDGRRILSGGADNTVRLWLTSTGLELAKYDRHTDVVRGVAFFPDGKRALSGGDDKTLQVSELPPDVPDIIAKLANPDVKVKQQAVQDLAKFGDEAKPAVPALIKCLGVGDAGFRQQVLALLKQLDGVPGRDDVKLLATMAADKTFPDGRPFALDALAKLGADAKPALTALVGLLKDNDVALKRKAIVVLGQIGPDARNEAYAPLVEFLRDPDAETVKIAVEALAKLGKPGKEQVVALGDFLKDANDSVRQFALKELTDLGPEAEPVLVRVVEVAKSDKLPELRKAALAALVKIKPKDMLTVDLLTIALKDEDAGVCLQALAALAEIGPNGGALRGMLQALDHKNEDIRKAADEAFGKAMFDKSHVKVLATTLGLSQSVRARTKIVEVLAKLGPDAEDAATALGKVAHDGEGDLRVAAIVALGNMGPAGRKSAGQLIEIMNDKNEKSESVQIEVAIALTKMEAPEAKQALPKLINGLLVTDATDMKQIERQDKVSKILVQIGAPAADPLAKALSNQFYSSNIKSADGQAKALARRKVIETLVQIGPKANTGQVQLELATAAKEDPDGRVREMAAKARIELQKK